MSRKTWLFLFKSWSFLQAHPGLWWFYRDGEYWIDPEKNSRPLKVLCDMTTDGGTEKNLCLLSYLSTRWKRQGFPKHWKSVANCNFGMLLALLKRKAAIKAIPNVQEISPNHLSSFPVKRMNEVSYHPAGFYKRRLHFFCARRREWLL